EAVASVGRTAGERALARLGARRLTTRKVPVAFNPDMSRGLFRHFIGAISGTSQYRKSSFLLNSAGEQIFPEFLEILERPHIPRGLASSPFDQEGAATRDRELVRDGVLGGYVLGSYSARRLGLKTTGNAGGAHNLLVRSQEGALDPKAFLGRLGTGLLVTELMGHGVNGVTGDYSRGASGFWVEQGAIAYPVHEITIAGNLKPMYRHIVALGDDVDVRGGIRTGSLLLDEMTVGGESTDTPEPGAGGVRTAHEVHEPERELLELRGREPQRLQPEPQIRGVLHVERQLRARQQDQPAEIGPQQRRHHHRESGVHQR